MMRKSLGIIACLSAFAVAGCAVSKERVTLLAPAQSGKDIGGVVIEYDDGRMGYLGDVSQQAKLRSGKAAHLVRQYDEADPQYANFGNDFPSEPVREYFYFAFGKDTLAPSELDRLQAWLNQNIQDRPGHEIEIAAHADISGGETFNDELTDRRADAVRAQVVELIDDGQISVDKDAVEDFGASSDWAQSIVDSGQDYVARDYRVAVVTIR